MFRADAWSSSPATPPGPAPTSPNSPKLSACRQSNLARSTKAGASSRRPTPCSQELHRAAAHLTHGIYRGWQTDRVTAGSGLWTCHHRRSAGPPNTGAVVPVRCVVHQPTPKTKMSGPDPDRSAIRAFQLVSGLADTAIGGLCAGVTETDCVVPPERLCIDQCSYHPWLILRELDGLEGAVRNAQGWLPEALVATGRKPEA
jgi:hypothetical protein